MIRKCSENDINEIYNIINDAAVAYKGIIPEDRWHEPYMPLSELQAQIADNIRFYCYEDDGEMLGVMGIQDKGEVTLIRHAYVRSNNRKKGIGGQLLSFLVATCSTPILIGTWADASWAIAFYEKHGFHKVSPEKTIKLLKKYWNIPERQIETSVVLSNSE